MSKAAKNDLQYYLLPSANPPFQYLELHNQVFRFWHDIWKSVFNELRYDTSLLVDDFIRQDVIACICSGQEVVGAHLYSFFSLDSEAARAFRYMTGNYPEIYFLKLKKLNIRNLMSMEYLTVHPKWRGRNQPVQIAAALVGLGNRVRDEFGADAGIGPSRRDHKVTDLVYSFGGDCIIENVINHNVACDLNALIRGRTHPHANPEIRSLEDHLWSRRVDTISSVAGATHRLKMTA